MTKFAILPEFSSLNFTLPLARWLLPMLQAATRQDFRRQPADPRVERVADQVQTADGPAVPVEIVSPRGSSGPLPALVFLHGGAFLLPAGGHHRRLIDDYAAGAECRVIHVDYRLGPHHPYPAAHQDSLAVVRWVFAQAERLGIDRSRIAVCGDSAGGALAAAVTQALRDQPSERLLFQMLIYPVTDHRQTTASMARFTKTPLWNSRLNARMWDLYLRDLRGKPVPPEASPATAASLANLPPAFVELAEFDCLHDEGEAYALRLRQDGVAVELTAVPGTVHGYEVSYDAPTTRASVAARIQYMKTQFARP